MNVTSLKQYPLVSDPSTWCLKSDQSHEMFLWTSKYRLFHIRCRISNFFENIKLELNQMSHRMANTQVVIVKINEIGLDLDLIRSKAKHSPRCQTPKSGWIWVGDPSHCRSFTFLSYFQPRRNIFKIFKEYFQNIFNLC